jgi:hypothetical protein
MIELGADLSPPDSRKPAGESGICGHALVSKSILRARLESLGRLGWFIALRTRQASIRGVMLPWHIAASRDNSVFQVPFAPPTSRLHLYWKYRPQSA